MYFPGKSCLLDQWYHGQILDDNGIGLYQVLQLIEFLERAELIYGDRVAVVEHLLARQHVQRHQPVVGRLFGGGRRLGGDVGQIVPADHRLHARMRECARRVDSHDARVGVRTAQERDVAHKIAHDVAGVTHVINSIQLR